MRKLLAPLVALSALLAGALWFSGWTSRSVSVALSTDGVPPHGEHRETLRRRMGSTFLSRDLPDDLRVVRGRRIDLHLPHVGLWDAREYFRQGGAEGERDAVEIRGVENYSVLVHVAHGLAGESPGEEELYARRELPVGLSEVSLGDFSTRYAFLLACEVLAHGPDENSRSPPASYSRPGGFCAGAQCSGHRSAFDTWLRSGQGGFRSFGPHLRLVCGGSSKIAVTEAKVMEFADAISSARRTMADAFILAFSERGGNLPLVPACLAFGGASVRGSALFDVVPRLGRRRIEPASRRAAYLEYPVFVGGEEVNSCSPVGGYPVLEVGAARPAAGLVDEMPQRLQRRLRKPVAGVLDEVAEGLRLEFESRTGFVRLSSDRWSPNGTGASQASAGPSDWHFLDSVEIPGRSSKNEGRTELWIQAASIGAHGEVESVSHWRKGSRFERRFFVEVPGEDCLVPVIGPGGKAELFARESGGLFDYQLVAREVKGELDETVVLSAPPLVAAQEELRRRGKAAAVHHESEWGYYEFGAGCDQSEMRIGYRFKFWLEDPGAPVEIVDLVCRSDGDVGAGAICEPPTCEE